MRIEYIAGLFDGEGSVGLYRFHGDKFYLRTQLTQNKSLVSTNLMEDLQKRFGGNYSKQRSLSGRIKYNWQLGGNKAVNFLKKILPHLRLKYSQAVLAIKWQSNRPKPLRTNTGHFGRYPRRASDLRVSRQLKKLKG